MNKLFKGAIAGAAGVALLLGGAGTFALWNDVTTIGTEEAITAGQLRFGDTSDLDAAWQLNGIDIADPSGVLIVPGDVLTYSIDGVPVYATGTHLTAELGVDWDGLIAGTGAPQSTELLTALGEPDFLVNGASTNVIEVTPGASAQTFDVAVRMVFDPDTTGQTAQTGVVNLSGFHLTLQQTTNTSPGGTGTPQVPPTP